MMVQRQVFLYAIYDTVAEDFSPVFEAINDAIAMRYFRKMLVEVPEKAEYKLYRVGDYEINEKLKTGIELCGTEPVEVPNA